MATIDDIGGAGSGSSLSFPPFGGPDGWAAAVRDALHAAGDRAQAECPAAAGAVSDSAVWREGGTVIAHLDVTPASDAAPGTPLAYVPVEYWPPRAWNAVAYDLNTGGPVLLNITPSGVIVPAAAVVLGGHRLVGAVSWPVWAAAGVLPR